MITKNDVKVANTIVNTTNYVRFCGIFFVFVVIQSEKLFFMYFLFVLDGFYMGMRKKGCNFVLPTSLELTKPRCRKTNKDKNIADKSAINYKK